MRIKEITIRNFRNYKDYDLELGNQMTVLIGKNGVGKTNLLDSIRYALSAFFDKKKGMENYDFLKSCQAKFKTYSATDAFYGTLVGRRNASDYHYPVSISADASLENIPLRWELTKESLTEGVDKNQYTPASNLFWNISLGGSFPVLAFYSDSFPHIKNTLSKEMKEILESEFGLPQNGGYYKWNEEMNCTSIWETLFTDKWKNAKYKGKLYNEKYVSLVKDTLIEASSGACGSLVNSELELQDVAIESRGKQDKMILEFKDGRRMAFDQLPQGYKRVFSIVFDVVSRAYVLNKTTDSKQICGFVMIDEIELHLHPSLAQDVIQRLLYVFPNIQFLVTTHSPSVLTNYNTSPERLLYALEEENGKLMHTLIDNTYGVDINVIVKEQMGAGCRDAHVQKLINDVWKDIADRDLISAKNVITRLEQITDSNQPELIKMRGVVKRLEILGK